MRRKLNDLLDQRTKALEKAEGLLREGKQAEYETEMTAIKGLNTQIKSIQDLVAEQDRQFLKKAPDPREEKDKAAERGNALLKGQAIQFTAKELYRDLRQKSVTMASDTLALPTGSSPTIRDNMTGVSSIVDQVYVENLEGMGSYMVPYVVSELGARGGKVSTNAGQSRTPSTSPVFAYARISPYEVNVTETVDRNIARFSPADYYAKIYSMAMKAMRRKLAELIVNGDGQSSPDMYGIKNAKNAQGNPIYSTVSISAIDETLLDELYFGFGGDEELGGARLFAHKLDMKAIGKLRNSDKQRVFRINGSGSGNTGTIEDGGAITPYTIVSALTPLSTATKGASPVQTMLYGDPMSYMLGLFGPMTVRVDESCNAEARLLTILGDAMVGGNLTVDKGFSVATLPANG